MIDREMPRQFMMSAIPHFEGTGRKLESTSEMRSSMVSVIMPSFNNARYIDEAIAGVVGQSWGRLELIIVDDGSTDESPVIIQKWLDRDVRINLVTHEMNRGVSSALNTGLRNARGHYIGFCASDDIWLPHKIAVELECFARFPEVGVVHSDSEIINDSSHRTGELFSAIYQTAMKARAGNLLQDLLVGNYISAPTVLLRKDCVQTVGMFPESIKWLEDWVYMVRVARRFTFYYIPDILVQYRIHSGSSSADRLGYEKSRVRARLILLSEIPEMALSTRLLYYRQIITSCIKLIAKRIWMSRLLGFALGPSNLVRKTANRVLSVLPAQVVRLFGKFKSSSER